MGWCARMSISVRISLQGTKGDSVLVVTFWFLGFGVFCIQFCSFLLCAVLNSAWWVLVLTQTSEASCNTNKAHSSSHYILGRLVHCFYNCFCLCWKISADASCIFESSSLKDRLTTDLQDQSPSLPALPSVVHLFANGRGEAMRLRPAGHRLFQL